MLHSEVLHRSQKVDSTRNVCGVVDLRYSMRFGDQGLAGKMQHTFDVMTLKRTLEAFRIAEIAFYQRCVADEIAMTGGKIVEDKRFESAGAQCGHRMGADVTRTARYENHVR